ncbi:TolC family protein [Sediminitomix flava]|uniref:Outer membrane protein TolC n=1 Tax=Sediminitomix flava TaxID=379075 RepID=A0A316A3G4_SEDFL|nr:TolC family protein [Sediminitomix flava]PWJ44267.1 outer membrane protein TolC [Sediminitomix flava]
MRQSLVMVLLALFYASSVHVVWAQKSDTVPTSFSMEEAVNYAMMHNKEVTIADLNEAISNMQTKEFVSQGLPQINGSAQLDYNFELMTMGTDENGNPIQFGSEYGGQAGISLSQMLFDGSFLVGLKASRTYQDLAIKQTTQQKIDIVEQVQKAYFLALVNEENREAIQRNYDRLKQLLYETEEMYKNGFAEKIDVQRIRVNYNSVVLQLEQNKQEIELAYMLLKFQMGYNIDTEIQLKDHLSDQHLNETLMTSDMQYAYQNRIEYDILNTQFTLKELERKENNFQYMPKLNLVANYGWANFGDDFGAYWTSANWFPNGSVGVKMTVPIFDGLLKSRKSQRMKLEMQQISTQKDLMKDNVAVEVKKAADQLSTSLKALQIYEDNMGLAKEVYEHSLAKYQEGIGSNLEVIEADGSYKDAQDEYYSSLYNALVAQIALQKANGTLYHVAPESE